MNSKEICNIREWAPLTVVEQIPARIQKGILFPANLNLTCVDAVKEFIALGSDAGIVFWYNRYTGEVQKLRAETNARITCVKIVDSVEYMVAAGSSTGQVSVFQIQKKLPPDLNLVAPFARPKPIQRYTIRDLHHSWVSCCEWTKNGMKLYSGDREGVVVLTELDYQAHISKSIEVLNEAYEVVQLNAYQSYLLVSTLYRTIICQRHVLTGDWQIIQIGKKERKKLADCGSIFLRPDNPNKCPLLLCGRPGLRFWLADLNGNVDKTILFRDVITKNPKWEIPILNPKSNYMQRSTTHLTNDDQTAMPNFRNLYLYAGQNTLVVTHDDVNLYLLNMETLRLEAVARNLRNILDFCVVDKEIFVLEGGRSLLRLAPMPEKPNKNAKVIFNPSMPPPIPMLGLAKNQVFEAPVEFEPEEQNAVSAEECFELPPIEKLNLNIPIELAVESPRAEQSRRLEVFKQISERDYDAPIVHHSDILKNSRKKRLSNADSNHTLNKPSGIVEIAKDVCVNENIKNVMQKENKIKEQRPKTLEFTTKPTEMDASFCLPSTSASASTMLNYIPHLPDILSPNTLQQAIATKAKNLAEELQLPKVSLEPITIEELKTSQALAAPPPPPLPKAKSFATVKDSTLKLSQAYPQSEQLIVGDKTDAVKQQNASFNTVTTTRNYSEEIGNYSAGQPVDDVCTPLTLIKNITEIKITKDPLPPLRTYISTQPEDEVEINSFLLDFNRASDPLKSKDPPQSEESNTSSEWEFLDN